MKRTATIKSVTPCVLYSLSKTQLDEVLSHHPNMAHAIRKVAEERLAQQQAQEKPPTNTDSSSSLDQVNEEEKEEQEFNLMEHQSDKKSDNGSEREQS